MAHNLALSLYSDRTQIFFERNYESVNMGLVVCTLVTEAMDGEELAGKVSSYIEKRFRALIRNAQRREGA